MAITISGSDVQNSIKRSLDILNETYKEDSDSGEFGWYHYLDDPGIGVSASVVALYCFSVSGQEFTETEKVLQYIKSKQFTSSDETRAGGWCIRTIPHTPILEATAWTVYALGVDRLLFQDDLPNLKFGYHWLCRNQNTDFGWGSFLGQPSRTYTTSRAILALSCLNRFSKEAALGADWLIRNRSGDLPAWGATPGKPPTLVHTALALQALTSIPYKITDTELVESLDWLEQNLDTNRLFEVSSQAEDYEIHCEENGVSITFPASLAHFSLPLVVSTILKLSPNPPSLKLYEGVQTILNSQNKDGIWELPRNPNRPSIWAIWPFVVTLNQILKTPSVYSYTNLTAWRNYTIANVSQEPPIRLIANIAFESIQRIAKKYFGWFALGAFILAGVSLSLLQVIGWLEFFLSLLVPVILLLVQLRIEGRN